MTRKDEADKCIEVSQRFELLSQRVINSLKKNNIDAVYAKDRDQALEEVINAIPQNASIGIGDSMTLHQIGLFNWLKKENRQVFQADEFS